MLIHGYHPYASDGSIYVAGIQKVMTPALYAADGDFVGAHMRLSIFSTVMAAASSLLHMPLDLLLLAVYFLATAAALLAADRLGRRLLGTREAGWGAALLLTCCFTVPVAATSLLLADPYLTARSLTLPITLLALLFAVDRAWLRAAVCCVVVGLFHPLMGAHLLLFLLTLFLVQAKLWRVAAGLCVAVFAGAALLHLASVGASGETAYLEAVASRSYYFLAGWRWFEILGLILPLVLLALVAGRRGQRGALRALALTCVLVGGTCGLVSVCFVHRGQADLLMRIQPLRAFHTIYLLGAILLGGALAKRTRVAGRTHPGAAAVYAVALTGLAVGMFALERSTYGPDSHLELPAVLGGPAGGDRDQWQKAFLWVRDNTPPSAEFAGDVAFLEDQGESMPGFRALARRGILTDQKDEGLASLFPRIAPAWAARRDREVGLNRMSDAARVATLSGTGVGWILLAPAAVTGFPCPFHNQVVKACKLPGAGGG